MAEINRSTILQTIQQYARESILPLTDAVKIAAKHNCSLRDIETIALEHCITPSRFQRNSLSCPEQLRLFRSRVAIIGCGGLGGRTAELLARIGVGHLLLTDPDIFSESNLNRQIFCNTKSLGYNKVDIVSQELLTINPALTSTPQVRHFNSSSINTADIVVDALDSTEARIELSKLCREQNIPMIHGAVKEWYGQAGIDQASSPLIQTLYTQQKGPAATPKVLPMTVSLIASIQATETCKYLLGHDSPLTGNWLQTDLRQCQFDTIPISYDI